MHAYRVMSGPYGTRMCTMVLKHVTSRLMTTCHYGFFSNLSLGQSTRILYETQCMYTMMCKHMHMYICAYIIVLFVDKSQ
jgi:hypothetical protein